MNDLDNISLGGHWILAIIMVVLVSWLLYKYLVPKGAKEWRNAGLLQAFIIALYAEMYGFPLTIYILTSFLHLKIPWSHFKGHLWATLLGYGNTGAFVEMIIGYSIIIIGFYLIARGWSKIYRFREENQLVTDGIYKYIRHPQYTGIFFIIFGQLIHWPTIPTLILFPIIIGAYIHLARKEELSMIEKYGGDYIEYRKKVPMFFPHINKIKYLLWKSVRD